MNEFFRWGTDIWERVTYSQIYSAIFYALVAGALFVFGLARRKSSP